MSRWLCPCPERSSRTALPAATVRGARGQQRLFHAERRGTDRDVSDSCSVTGDVENHGSKNDRCERGVESLSVVGQGAVCVEGEEVECNGGQDESSRHARDGPACDTTTTSAIDDGESDEGEDEAVQGQKVSATRRRREEPAHLVIAMTKPMTSEFSNPTLLNKVGA